MTGFARFRDFWPYYLQQHARSGTRVLHYVGTGMVLVLTAAASVTGRWGFTAVMPVAGYGFAWVAHGTIERNRPATFGHPLWSLGADFLMFWRFLTGRLGRDLMAAGVRPDGSVDPVRRVVV